MSVSLAESDPVWIVDDGRVVGITFRCPVPGHDHCYHGVKFENPPDGGGPPRKGVGPNGEPVGEVFWHREGDTLETLTLSPSILVRGAGGGEHWHGFIQHGRVVTV